MSRLSSWDMARLAVLEDKWLEDDRDDSDEYDNDMWLKADDEVEERWFQELREGGL